MVQTYNALSSNRSVFTELVDNILYTKTGKSSWKCSPGAPVITLRDFIMATQSAKKTPKKTPATKAPTLKDTIKGMTQEKRDQQLKEYLTWIDTHNKVSEEQAKSELTSLLSDLTRVAENMRGQATPKQQADLNRIAMMLSSNVPVDSRFFTRDTIANLLQSSGCTSFGTTMSWNDICTAMGANPREEAVKDIKAGIDSGGDSAGTSGIRHNGKNKRASGYYYFTHETSE